MPIDYAAMKREHPKLKASLTRAINSKDPVKVLTAVEQAYDAFDRIGAWPDDWHRWNIAVGDAWMNFQRSDAFDDDHFDNRKVIADRFYHAMDRAN